MVWYGLTREDYDVLAASDMPGQKLLAEGRSACIGLVT